MTGPGRDAPGVGPSPAPGKRRRRGCAVALALAGLAAALTARPVLRGAPGLLVEAQDPRPADAVVVLAGDHRGRRVDHGVALLRAGHVATGPFVVSGGRLYAETTWAELMAARAVAAGVPAARIVRQDRSTTTEEDAAFTVALLRARGVRSVLLVTSPWHSRRAARLFRRAAPELEVVSCPGAPELAPGTDWWTDPVAARALATEVLKHLWPGPG